MKIVRFLIFSDRVHDRIQPVADTEIVLVKRHTLPFCEGMNDLRLFSRVGKFKFNGTLNAVQIVVESRFGIDKKRRGDSFQVKCFAQISLKCSVCETDSRLSLVKVKF